MTDTLPNAAYRSGHFYTFALLGWVALTLLALYVVLDGSVKDVEREFQHEAAESVLEVRQKLQVNESVLSGFAAFLHAVESGDRESMTRYARAAMNPYPHIHMLEVARRISATERPGFEAEMQRAWLPGFTLRDFVYQGARRWQEVQTKAEYWPLVFLYPEGHDVAALHGLDLDSVSFLARPLKEARQRQTQTISRPFRLAAGEQGFVMFQAVERSVGDPAAARRPLGGPLAAMLVVKATALRPGQLDRRDEVRAEFVLPELGEVSEVPPLFIQEAAPVHEFDRLLPSVRQDMSIHAGPQLLRVSFVRQLRWSDLAGFNLRAVAVISLLSLTLVMLYLRRHYIAMQLAEREHERAEFLAMHDPLTDLPNRRLLADRVRQAQLRWQRGGTMFALFLIDFDHFKKINDDYGHEGGDHLLKVAAHRISSSLRATDTVARYGGDEFVVLIADIQGEAEARTVGEKLLTVVSEPVLFGQLTMRVTCSLGVALCPRDGNDFETLRHQADHAMYRVKAGGRNAVCSDSLGPFAPPGVLPVAANAAASG